MGVSGWKGGGLGGDSMVVAVVLSEWNGDDGNGMIMVS
jgi:hypothetical protein